MIAEAIERAKCFVYSVERIRFTASAPVSRAEGWPDRVTSATMRSVPIPQTLVFVGVVFALHLLIYGTFGLHYFFLFDDFAVIGEAAAKSWTAIVGTPIFNFYRPTLLLFTKAINHWAGWEHPAAYAWLCSAVHLANATLVGRMAALCGASRIGAALALILFLLSPWSSEATFWVGGVVDILVAAGMLIALTCGLLLASPRSVPVAVLYVTGCAGALFAAFSKETAVMLPALMVTAWLLRGESLRSLRQMPLLTYLLSLTFIIVGYLIVRSQVLPGLNSAYGSAEELFARAPLLENYALYWYASLRPPTPPGLVRGALLYPFMFVAFPMTLIWLGWRHPRVLLWGAGGFTLSVLPTLWMPPDIDVTNQRRLLYFPTIWISLSLGWALGSLWTLRRSLPHRIIPAAAIAATLAAAAASTLYQRNLWLTSARISESVIRQLEPAIRAGEPVRIVNYPTRCAEGPRIHQPYSLRYYYGTEGMPPVRFEGVVVTCSGLIGRVVRAATESVHGYPDAVAARERILTLRVP